MDAALQPHELFAALQTGERACAVLRGSALRPVFASDRFRGRLRLPDEDDARAAASFRLLCNQVLTSGVAAEASLENLAGDMTPVIITRLSHTGDGLLMIEEIPCEPPAPEIRSIDTGTLDAQTEQRLRSVIDSAPFPIALYLGREMRVAYANRSLMDVWGKGYDVIGKTYYEALPELKSQGVYELLDGVFTSGKAYSVRNQRIDLEVAGIMQTSYFNYSFTPLFDSKGKVYGVLNTAADVTDSNAARQQLEESELFAKSIIENSPVAKLVLIGENMTIKTANSNMLEMLGRDRSIIGLPFADALPELANSPLIYRMRHVLASGETFVEPEGRIDIVKFGKPYTGYYNFIYKALPNTSGDIYGIIITATDVTDLILTRKRIEETQAALQGAIELAELATWSYRFNDGIVNFSQRLRQWHGMEQDTVVTFDGLLHHIPEPDRTRMRGSFRSLQEPGAMRTYDEEYPVRNLQTGATHIVHMQGRLTLDDHGKPVKWSGAANDVTRQRKAQLALEQLVQLRTEELAASNEELQTANEELAEVNVSLIHSNEELAQYAYVASHDLQEPLRKIRLFSGMLLEKLGQDAETAPLVSRIGQSATRMHQLIRDLLEFSRLLKSDELMSLVNLNQIVEAVCNDFELSIREKATEIETGELPVIEAIGLQMNQLFYNLIGNAVKFNAPDRPPKIRIGAREMQNAEVQKHIARPVPGAAYFDITIADNGIGLEPQYAEQIFEVFKRLHTRESYPGSGIGLALCRRIVSNHNGHLYVESKPDAGSTFHIILPRTQRSF